MKAFVSLKNRFILITLLLPASVLADVSDSTAQAAALQAFASFSNIRNLYPTKAVNGDELTPGRADRLGLGVKSNFANGATLSARLNLQNGTRSSFQSAFLEGQISTLDWLAVGLRAGAINNFEGNSGLDGLHFGSGPDLGFAGMILAPVDVNLGAGFKLVSTSLRGFDPFDGVLSWDIRSSVYVTLGFPLGIAKTWGDLLTVQVRTGFHELMGSASEISFIPLDAEVSIKVSSVTDIGLSYELPGNLKSPSQNKDQTGEYYLFERSASVWMTTRF